MMDGEEDRDALTYKRKGFWQTTSNKQLNFLRFREAATSR